MSLDPSTEKLIQPFLDAVHTTHQRLTRNYYLAIVAIIIAILIFGFALLGLVETGYYLSSSVKTIGLLSVIVAAISAGVYTYSHYSSPTFRHLYQQFSRQKNRSQLADAFDLHLENNRNNSLKEAAIKQNISKLNPRKIHEELRDFSDSHPLKKLYRKALGVVLFGMGTLVLFIFSNPMATERLATFWATFNPPNPYNFVVEPGSVTVEQGESFAPTIRFTDEVPNDISLSFKSNIENQYRERRPESVDDAAASFTPISISTNGTYYLTMDGFKSEAYEINVQLRPRFESLTFNVIPPDYTQLDSTTYSYPLSKVQAYQGSTIEITGVPNKSLSELLYISSNLDDTLEVYQDTTQANRYTIKTKVEALDTLSFRMQDETNLTNKNNFQVVIDPRTDQPPFVDLIAPTENITMQNPEPVNIEYEAGDDFGLTRAELHYEHQRAFTSEPEIGSIELQTPSINDQQSYTWQLSELNPKARDQITYWVRVYDNDRYSGAKKGESQKMDITFPSATEYMDELDSREREVSESLEDVSKSFDQMQQEYDEFRKKLQQNPETDWEQKQQLEDVERERQEIDKKVDDLNKKFEQIKKDIEQNQSLSPETMESYDELQKLMKEINDPELEKALDELRNSLGEMSPDEMREALQNYEFNEEQYRQRINRTLNLFKSLKLNSDLEKAARSLEDLAEQEKTLSESNAPSKEEISQQKAIENDLSDLEEQLQEINENAPDKAKSKINELQEQSQQQLKEIKKQLQENIDKLQQESPDSGSEINEQQQQIRQQLEQQAQQMRAAKQQLNQQQRNVNITALEYVLHSLLNLSLNQEKLTKETEELPPRSNAFVGKAQRERNISDQFRMLSDSLYKVSSEIPSFSNQINKKKAEIEGHLNRSVEMLAERDRSNATSAQRQSLGGLNKLATMVASLLDQLNNQQGGGSGGAMSMQQLMEQIKKMSGEQQQINQQIQEMINDMQGNRLSQDQMERLNQLSKQQNRIRKQMRELQRRGELEPGDRVLSELERMSEQMEDAINDLRGGQLDESMVQRQENILSRMLNAEKAIQERGKEERREATTAEEREKQASPDVTLEELQKQVRKMINDPDYTKFTEDYQRLIEQYFELLQEYDN
ncbi:DUF4175 family protein [Fodinibius sp. Rm-B-1B1-1]|uniref:DUF4175 family protein n=1 Tax=Fodinibius alkaliphilus TaxID=3140241 RepID=UPI00315AAA8A